MNPQLSFEITYVDDQLMVIDVSASNGRFTGVTKIYVGVDGQELIDFAHQFQGFPKNIDQVEKKEFGSINPFSPPITNKKLQSGNQRIESAYLGLKLFCLDRSGHTAVGIEMQEDYWHERKEAIGKVSFEMLFNPAQADIFVQELIELGKNHSGRATLMGIIDQKDNRF
jgi:hypothetical protein